MTIYSCNKLKFHKCADSFKIGISQNYNEASTDQGNETAKRADRRRLTKTYLCLVYKSPFNRTNGHFYFVDVDTFVLFFGISFSSSLNSIILLFIYKRSPSKRIHR